MSNDNNKKGKEAEPISLSENLNISMSIDIEFLTPTERKIFKFLYWYVNNLQTVYLSENTIAIQCSTCKKTVQRFIKKFKGKLVNVKYRFMKTNLWSIPEKVIFYIKRLGGIKIVTHYHKYKDRILKECFEDPNSEEFTESYEQTVNKKAAKMSAGDTSKCPTSLNNVFNSYLDEVPLGKSDKNQQKEEILLRFGLKSEQIDMLNYTSSGKSISQAIDDALWYKKIGKKINTPFAFIASRAKHHMFTFVGGLNSPKTNDRHFSNMSYR